MVQKIVFKNEELVKAWFVRLRACAHEENGSECKSRSSFVVALLAIVAESLAKEYFEI